MIWRGDQWRRVKGNESFEKEMHQGDHRPEALEHWFLIFSSTHDYLQLRAYHDRKVKAMLDNGTIMGITLEPLRLQKGFLTKAIMQTVWLEALSCHNIVSIALKVKS